MSAPLNDYHARLRANQQSDLMDKFAGLRADRRITAIGISAALGLVCSALAWTGTSSDRIHFCLVNPTQDLQCYDSNKRPFLMTQHHWDQWIANGKPDQVIPNPKLNKGLVPATNPYKALWALGGFAGFAAAGWMLRHMQHEEATIAPLETIAQRRDEAIAELNARAAVLEAARFPAMQQAELEADVELARFEHQIRLNHAQMLGETELTIAQLEAEEIRMEAQTAGLSEEQKAEYLEFVRSVESPYLTGTQTLQGTIDPSDKVGNGAPMEPIAAAAAEPAQDELYFDIHKLRPTSPDRSRNVLLIAEQDAGKSTLALWLAHEVYGATDLQVYDLDATKDTWGNLPVWGLGDDSSEISGAMQADEQLFDTRTQDRLKGRSFPISIRLVDETPALVSVIRKRFEEWSFMMSSRARKRGLMCILLTQYRDWEANGLNKDSAKGFTQIYLGRKQCNHALNYLIRPRSVAEELRPSIDKCSRPALVEHFGEWFWWDVPNLKDWKADFLQQTNQQINPTSDTQLGIKSAEPQQAETIDPVEQLERLWQLEPTPEAEAANIADKLTPLEIKIHNAAVAKPEGLTARDVIRLGFAELNGILAADRAEAVRSCFLSLESTGVGKCRAEKTLRYFAQNGEI